MPEPMPSILSEERGMLFWTGPVDQTEDLMALARLERDEQVLGL